MPPQMDELKEVKSADPFTVIENANLDSHEGKRDSLWVKELSSRFEAQCKAGYGTNVPIETGSSRS